MGAGSIIRKAYNVTELYLATCDVFRLFRAGALRHLKLQLAENVFASKCEGGRKV